MTYLTHLDRLEAEAIHIMREVASVAEQRDVKGLYKRARAGEIKNFTGLDSPYEAPENPELAINTVDQTAEEAANKIVTWIRERGWFEV